MQHLNLMQLIFIMKNLFIFNVLQLLLVNRKCLHSIKITNTFHVSRKRDSLLNGREPMPSHLYEVIEGMTWLTVKIYRISNYGRIVRDKNSRTKRSGKKVMLYILYVHKLSNRTFDLLRAIIGSCQIVLVIAVIYFSTTGIFRIIQIFSKFFIVNIFTFKLWQMTLRTITLNYHRIPAIFVKPWNLQTVFLFDFQTIK